MNIVSDLAFFVVLARQPSLAAAAQEMGITPPNVSRRLAALERRLGLRLLNRTTLRLSLTAEGQRYLDEGERILQDLEGLEQALTAGRETPRGLLRVNATFGFGRTWLGPALASFQSLHPKVSVQVQLTEQLPDLTLDGLDGAIWLWSAPAQRAGEWVARRLATNQRVVCGTPAYFRKHGKPRTLDDLALHNCLAFNLQGGQQRGWYFQQQGKTITVRVNGNLDCNDGELLHRWVSEGLGLGWRSTWEIQAQLARGELMTVLDEFALPAYDILAVYPQQRHLPAKVRFFIDHLKKTYAKPHYWTS